MPTAPRPVAAALACTLLAAAGASLAGCHRPHGALFSHAGGSQTYLSTEMAPKNVSVRDRRTNEVVFSMEVPVGKQLVIQFREGEGDDPVYTPDLMRYSIMDAGKWTGSLRSSITVPPATSRMVEVSMRQGPEYVANDANEVLRVDDPGERPDWWTADGGTGGSPDSGRTNYDG